MDKRIIGSIIVGLASIAFTAYCFKKADEQLEEMEDRPARTIDTSALEFLNKLKEPQEEMLKLAKDPAIAEVRDGTAIYRIHINTEKKRNSNLEYRDRLSKEVHRLKDKGFSDKDIIRILHLDQYSFDLLMKVGFPS